MSFLLTYEEPYGFLNFIHTYIIQHAKPITSSNWPSVFILPFIPLGIQTLLLQFQGTRLLRAALGALGLYLVGHGCGLHRFVEPEYNAFNNGLGIAMLHISAKYVEYSFTSKPIIDPYFAAGRRGRIVAAIDLAINSRMVGLGQTYIDLPRFEQDPRLDSELKLESEAKLDSEPRLEQQSKPKLTQDADGGVRTSNGSVPQRLSPTKAEKWLPYPTVHRTRPQAIFRHFRNMVIHYIVLDTLLVLLRQWGSETIGNLHGCPNSIPKFLSSNTFYFFPGTLNILAPKMLVLIVMLLSLAIGVWQGLLLGYHSFALVAVGSGVYEVEAWEVDFMDAPWKGDSLLDLWGRRWHQLFRHTFLITSILILKAFRQPPNSPFLLPLIFFLSGALHALGQITMDPVPSILPLLAFFLASGVGCALEVAFKKVSGKRVGGWSGKVWVWTYMLVTARLACGSWFDSGLAAARLTPVEVPGGWTPGNLLMGPITKWIINTS
ncbi:hypothetical protein BCR39DRAFT_549199 [Naematelia encephala]|uniref:Wax synthase domain-containing protein n=1 Tax=Naematelia encephala TaxID=71784 RepID=A0A1Y2AMA2_9TREE|nr:hypothetical protein BCR39DRAFT_549199 [Naematelia encephala]